MKPLLYFCLWFLTLPLLAQQKTPTPPPKNSLDVKTKDSIDVNLLSVYDLDSNRYEVIKIGNQYWFKENLKTTHYRDTTWIVSGLNASQWKEAKSGAYAIYENNPINNIEKYGLSCTMATQQHPASFVRLGGIFRY
jgi:hypothetical protein